MITTMPLPDASHSQGLVRPDRRRGPRRKTFARALLHVGGGAPVDCVLIERSGSGASVLLDTDRAFPGEGMALFTYHDHKTALVRVRWRHGRRLGVQFLGAI